MQARKIETNEPVVIKNEEGKVGYILAWLLGVPVWLLIIVYLIRG